MNVIDFYGNKPQEGSYGIEIEVEGVNLPAVANNVWTTTHDGSLRGESAEYVLKKPLDIDKVEIEIGRAHV